MRLLITLHDQLEATRFSEFLKSQGIENECEVVPVTDWGSSEYGTYTCNIWVIEEDQVEDAKAFAEEFKKNPKNPSFLKKGQIGSVPLFAKLEDYVTKPSSSSPSPSAPDRERGLGIVTLYLLITCTLLFMYGEVTTPLIQMPSLPIPLTPLYTPPINKPLLYDYPEAFELIDHLVKAYGIEAIQNLQELPPEGQILLNKALHTPYWQGFYDLVVAKFKNPQSSWNFAAPLFEKIRQGEVWRLFTPCLLHGNLLHLFFNMIWLLVLGKMMEERLGIFHYVLFIIITAIFSNTAQYLMSGSDFIGFSGVICAMLGFIWARQCKAAWEGYRLMPGTLPFVLFFILAMAGIQLIGFLMEVFWNYPGFSVIANTAHFSGGILGYLLGRLNFFAIKKV